MSSQHEERCLGSAVTEIISFFPRVPSEVILRPDRKPSFPWVQQSHSSRARSQQHGDPGIRAGCFPFGMSGHLSPPSASLAPGHCPPTMRLLPLGQGPHQGPGAATLCVQLRQVLAWLPGLRYPEQDAHIQALSPPVWDGKAAQCRSQVSFAMNICSFLFFFLVKRKHFCRE